MHAVFRVVLAAILAATAATTALILPSSAVAAVSGGGVSIRLLPDSTTSSDPRSQAYITDSVVPGRTLTRTVQISNSETSRQVIALSAGAASIQHGAFVGAAAGQSNELTSWTSLNRTSVTLAPTATTDVTVTITVPSTAAPGERYGVIWAAVTSPPAPGSQVRTINRVGIRMYLDVAGNGQPAPAFAIHGIHASTGNNATAISVDVANTGGRALDLTGTLRLTSSSNLTAGPFATQQALTLAPGTSGSVHIRTSAPLPQGTWRGTVSITGGSIVHTDTTLVTVTPPKRTPARGISAQAIILIVLAALLVIAILTALAVIRRRRRA